MLTEFQKKWVEALRSSKYKQGKKSLKNGDEFCCLGVACDLIDSTAWKDGFYHDQWFIPGKQDLEKMGISVSFATFLAQMNDIHSLGFNQIADYIEEKLGNK